MTDTGPWHDLVSTALVGTARRAVPHTPGLPEAAGDDPAAVLLDRAALAAVQRRAGHVPRRVAPPPAAPAETAPHLRAAAVTRLNSILTGPHRDLLAEWLDLAVATGRRLPPELLPALLDRGRHETALRPALARLGGERARWLARHNPAWAYLDDAVETAFDPEEWKTGTAGQRRAQLAALRRTDPAAARDLLAETWPNERAEQRLRLLETFRTGLSREDEPFLDTALDDRASRVRALAATLLAQLPDSAHSRRLAAHAVRLLRRPRPRRPVEITLPDLADTDLAAALGVSPTDTADPKGDKRRERLWALVSHTPLETWIGHLGDTPVDVVAATGDWDLCCALANAAVLQRDRAWARALLTPMMTRLVNHQNPRASRASALLALLDAEEQCAWVLRWSGSRPTAQRLLPLLEQLDCRWSADLAATVTEVILDPERTTMSLLTRLCHHAATRLDPALHRRFAEAADHHRDDDNNQATVADLAGTLKFRDDMRKELM